MLWISGNTTLVNQRLDNFSKDILELKENLEPTQGDTEQKFNKINENVSII